MTTTRIGEPLITGDRVRFTVEFLESTGQFTDEDRGPPWPCAWGYEARGTVVGVKAAAPVKLFRVRWDNGAETVTMAAYLMRYDLPSVEVVQARGWSLDAHARALRDGEDEQATLTHPSNWMSEAEVEDPRFGKWYNRALARRFIALGITMNDITGDFLGT